MAGRELALTRAEVAQLTRFRKIAGNEYVDVTWVPATSNDVERLFSVAGRVFSSMRPAMHPTTLETIVMLRFNRQLSSVSVVASAIQATRKRNAAVL
ncbi:TPA: hypothetical protein N0F65_004027 [Lagenidium giganteum]|uniref:HAT C-terminal dimerisation domain-containing protein n=1 Tax=Lagenidium giganteum TaxID=4803 RepID=A0AAV2YQ99_9STRA|nr:TPA: hypothetical protein N0F65_004027 [Lagenidium giganteum]